jgi:hypothetical protein
MQGHKHFMRFCSSFLFPSAPHLGLTGTKWHGLLPFSHQTRITAGQMINISE